LGLVVLAILNGIFRNYIIFPKTGESTAHIIGTIIFLILQFFVTYFFIKSVSERTIKKLLMIGIFWLTLTVFFEFIFGHYVMNHPWEKLLADYNIFRGRLWSLVLFNTLLSPLVCGKMIKNKLK